jgi:hypothetical protein
MAEQAMKWSVVAVGEAIVSSAKAMEYECLKPEQEKAVSKFVSGWDVLSPYLQASGRA